MAVMESMAKIIDPGDVELVPWPVKSILEGSPKAAFCVVGRSDDRRCYSGVWECTEGKFTVEYNWDETIYLIQGRVTLEEEGGRSREFGAGDVVHFPRGLRCTWTVHEKVRKIFTFFSPEPVDF